MKTNKKKLFVEANPLLDKNPSGIAKLLFSLIDALSGDEEFERQFEMTLVVPMSKRHLLDKWGLPKNIAVRTLPLPLRAINLLDKFNILPPIDLYLGRGVYLFPNYRQLPLIRSSSMTYIHDVAYKVHPDTVLEINRTFLERVVARSMRNSDKILTLSQQSYNELSDIFPENQHKVSIVPAGIDREKYSFSGNRSNITQALKKAGVNSREYVLFVGNIEPRKNINYLIDIYVNLIDRQLVPSTTKLLLVGGGGWNNEALLSRIDRLNTEGYAIVIPQSRISDEELPALYNQSLISTLLSVHEGFGMTPLEALAAEANVVVSDIPVLREVCGNAVSYAPLDNIQDAANVFASSIHGKKKPAEVQKQLEKFTWKKAASLVVDVASELANINVSRRS